MTTPMAIIVAAGMGSRLRPLTDDRPKCLMQVGATTILERALRLVRAAGIPEVAVVRGSCGDKITFPDVRYFDNLAFQENNILHSLFFAEQAMDGGFLFSYGDIVYEAAVLEALLASPEDIAVVVDRDWQKAYEGRDLHMEDEAEVVSDDERGIRLIGKGAVPPARATGEFIGLAKFSARGAALLRQEFHRLSERYAGRADAPFQRAKEFRKAYMTDMFQEMIDRGVRVAPVSIHGGWREIDTPQDLARANELFSAPV